MIYREASTAGMVSSVLFVQMVLILRKNRIIYKFLFKRKSELNSCVRNECIVIMCSKYIIVNCEYVELCGKVNSIPFRQLLFIKTVLTYVLRVELHTN
jgi:hypothetical protein